MNYKKRYKLNEVLKIIQEQLDKGIKFMELEDLLFIINFDQLDINMFHIKNIKYRLRYEREGDRKFVF